MYLPYDDRAKPRRIAEYLEVRRMIEEKRRRGDTRRPVEIYEEFVRMAEAAGAEGMI